jgi:putative ABC transport system substrate-binding protein
VLYRRTWLLGSFALLAAPPVVKAQPRAKQFRIGLLGGSSATSRESSHIWGAFFQGLRDLGYIEGQNVLIAGRFYGDSIEELPALVAELVRLPVDVIVAGAAPAPEMAKRATSTIPIVTPNHPDPVGSGLVASLARPGANVTGLSLVSPELRVKQIQLLKEAVPNLMSVALLSNPSLSSNAQDVRELEGAAPSLKVRLLVAEARAPSEFTEAFSKITKERAGALIILAGSMFFAHRARLAELAATNRIPSVYLLREYAEAGGLMTYGPDLRDNFRRAAGYVDRILKGANPGDLPIEQPTKFELVINLKAAKTLKLTLPRSVIARATRSSNDERASASAVGFLYPQPGGRATSVRRTTQCSGPVARGARPPAADRDRSPHRRRV